MQPHDLILAAAALVSEILGTLSGFGSSTLFVPVAQALEGFSFALALSALLHCFGNLAKLRVFRAELRTDRLLRLGVPFVAGSVIGALLSAQVSPERWRMALGVALVGVSLFKLLLSRPPSRRFSEATAAALCGLSGLATGLVGTGGAIRGIALGGLGLGSHEFVALSSAIDFGGDLLRAVIYLVEGYMDWRQWYYLPLLGVAAIAGARLGRKALNRVNPEQFERIVSFFVLLSGIGMIWESW